MKIRTFALLTALTLVNRATADTNQYVFTTIDLGETSDYSLTGTYLTGISASEQIVGYYSDGYSNRHAFVYAKGIFTRLQVPGSNFNEPLSISPSGKIVGICSMPGANIHLFVYDHGTYTIIPDPPSAQPGQTHASGINDAGQIAGYFVDKNYRYQAFVFNGGIYSTFDVNGLPNPQAQGINNSGQITGLVGKHGFVGQNNPFTILPDPPIQTSYSRAYPTFSGINASGQIVGTFWDSQSAHGFVYNDGIFTAIDAPDALWVVGPQKHLTEVTGVNDSGQLVGFYIDAKDRYHGFLATPVGTVVAGERLQVYIDKPNVQSGLLSDLVTVSGWAIDNQEVISSVRVAVDGIIQTNATYGVSRPDVCTA